MDGPSHTPEVPSQEGAQERNKDVKDNPLIEPVATKKQLIDVLLERGGGPDEGILKNRRYLIDKKKKNFFVVDAIHDEDDPSRNDIEHINYAAQLEKDGNVDSIDDLVGGYVWVEEERGGGFVLRNTGGSGSLGDNKGIDEDKDFQALFQEIRDVDPEAEKPEDPHLFILDKTYGAPKNGASQ